MRAGSAGEPAPKKQIIKEGLSEYFIYTIEGTETDPQRLVEAAAVVRSGQQCRFKIQYRYRPRNTASSSCGCTC